MAPAVGIDLGTTFSAIAVLNPTSGRVEVLPSREGEVTTPSVVLFDPSESEPLVGTQAKQLANAMPDRVVEMVKREMGGEAEYEFDGKVYSPVDISALILRKLKEDAGQRLGEPVKLAVITVPAYFGNREREATRQAGERAGLEVLRIINEPTAAAIAFRAEKSDQEQTVLVYDLGGGTFDVTLLKVTGDGITVLATDGDVRLGGKDWDEILIEEVARQFQARHGLDPREDQDAYQKLVAGAESAKRALTERQQVVVQCWAGGHRLDVPVTREQFDQMTSVLLERTRSTVNLVLDRVGMAAEAVNRVLLVGGSTRMPQVRRMLQEMFPGRTDTSINPDECVAMGAAIEASRQTLAGLPSGTKAALPRKSQQLAAMTIQDVTAHSLGTVVIKDDQLVTSFIIRKDAPIPAEQMRDHYVTTRDHQESLVVPVVQGESANPRLNQLLHCYEFIGIPPRAAGKSRLSVSFRYNADGIVEVHACDLATGHRLDSREYPLKSLDDLLARPVEPLRIVLLIDTSGSMAGQPLRHAKDGAIAFLNQMLKAELPPGAVQTGVIQFGERVETVVQLGTDLASAGRAVWNLSADGGTPMGDGIVLAHDLLRREKGRRVMVLLTDGSPSSKPHARQAAANARSEDIIIMAIACPGADEAFLAEICTPGVDVRAVTDTSQLSRTFGNLAAELARGGGIQAK